MITIFEQESEIGKCTFEPADSLAFKYGDPEFSIIYAHSVATVNGSRGLLKIEQHCYLRHGGEIPDQPWIKPEIMLEPPMGSRQEMVEFAREQHEKFCERVRTEFPDQYLVMS
ncbi:MAG: hypothetical protein JWM68_2962 [Verrucomicrobiales bacterium]|nr:hypothetical protein [Verrucomicrobiales bacterium]